jgi:23S rRNA (cytosine1962-C5)-methyltransferase
MPDDRYALLDFGDGRRLERFGRLVLDRPCPAAEGLQRADADTWSQADARFEQSERLAADGTSAQRGRWILRRELPERWTVSHGPLRFELKRTDFGHVGLFPEQAENWEWIVRVSSPLPLGEGQGEGGVGNGQQGSGFRGQNMGKSQSPHPLPLSQRERGDTLRILNLFAYTGGASLAAAAAGAEVVHVDAARNVVAWARRNAELSGLANAPIRWIVEDAVKFVKRELKRGNHYDAVILDPPSYGHGPRGEVWRLGKHLPRLLSLCGQLTAGRPQFMLLTCHTPGYDPAALREMLLESLGGGGAALARQLTLRSAAGRELPSGTVVRWERTQALER